MEAKVPKMKLVRSQDGITMYLAQFGDDRWIELQTDLFVAGGRVCLDADLAKGLRRERAIGIKALAEEE